VVRVAVPESFGPHVGVTEPRVATADTKLRPACIDSSAAPRGPPA
jgi:hypothetical protein